MIDLTAETGPEGPSPEHLFPKELVSVSTSGLHLYARGNGGPCVGKRVKEHSLPAQTGLEPPPAESDICLGNSLRR